MIKFENIPKLKDLKDTHGLFQLGTVVREDDTPLYLAWNIPGACALLLSSCDLTKPQVYCVVDDTGKPKRNTGVSALIFNKEYIDNEPIAFYGVMTQNKLQYIFVHLSAHITLNRPNEDSLYDIHPFVDQSMFDRIGNLIKEHINEV